MKVIIALCTISFVAILIVGCGDTTIPTEQAAQPPDQNSVGNTDPSPLANEEKFIDNGCLPEYDEEVPLFSIDTGGSGIGLFRTADLNQDGWLDVLATIAIFRDDPSLIQQRGQAGEGLALQHF